MSQSRRASTHSSLIREGSMNEPLPRYSALDDEWTVDAAREEFKSPLSDKRDDQRLIFNESIRDGTISADIEFKSIKSQSEGQDRLAGSLVFRFADPRNFYYA